jgi:hypothetical protein
VIYLHSASLEKEERLENKSSRQLHSTSLQDELEMIKKVGRTASAVISKNSPSHQQKRSLAEKEAAAKANQSKTEPPPAAAAHPAAAARAVIINHNKARDKNDPVKSIGWKMYTRL